MMLDRDQFINKIFEKHKLAIADNDPILGLIALNDVMLEHYIQQFEAALERLNQNILNSSQQNALAMKDHTEKIFGQAVYGLDQVLRSRTAAIEYAFQQHLAAIDKIHNSAKKFRDTTLFTAFGFFLASAIIVYFWATLSTR